MFSRHSNVLLTVMLAVIAAFAVAPRAYAETVDLPDGSKLDLSVACPQCYMTVGASALGPAALVLADGKVIGFDSTGDLFRYILEPQKYGLDAASIKNVFVTEYGTKTFIDAKKALYVAGSDVAGHMGPDVVAFSKKEDAEKFMADHHGVKLAPYTEVTADDLKAKKKMLKMKEEGSHEHGGMKH
jgi:copper chaperone NosL